MSNDFTQPVTILGITHSPEDQNASAEYVREQAGLEPLLDLPGALNVIEEAGYEQQKTDQPGWLFVHPDYGSAYCQFERDVLDFAEAVVESLSATRAVMDEAGYPDLTDDEIQYIAEHW